MLAFAIKRAGTPTTPTPSLSPSFAHPLPRYSTSRLSLSFVFYLAFFSPWPGRQRREGVPTTAMAVTWTTVYLWGTKYDTTYMTDKGETITYQSVGFCTLIKQFTKQVDDDVSKTSPHCQNEQGRLTTTHAPALNGDTDGDDARKGGTHPPHCGQHGRRKCGGQGGRGGSSPPERDMVILSANITFMQTTKGDFAILTGPL